MAKNKHDIIYTAADIEKYHKGLMTAGEMHALEKAALDDPFLADALEGYGFKQASIPADITDLQNRLNERTREEQSPVIPISKNKDSFSWWKVAAMLVIIAGAGWVVYQFGFNKDETEIAQAPKIEATKEPAIDSLAPAEPVKSATDSPIVNSPVKSQLENKPVTQETKPATAQQREPGETRSEAGNIAKAKSAPPVPLAADEVQGNAAEKEATLKKDPPDRDVASASGYDEQSKRLGQESIRSRIQQEKRAQGAEALFKNAERLAYQQPNVFRGRVTDEQNNALPFSNITNVRDSVGTYADANGFFNLTSPDTVLNVKISSIGFEPSIVNLQSNTTANRIKLEEDRTSLSEVVISDKKVNSTRAKNNNMVLEEAEPADGWSNYDLYLANNLKEPDEFKKETGIHGEVELSFEVNKSGEPINITVKKSLCDACDKEAIRLLKEGPKWKRKAKKGKTSVTIVF